MDNEKYINQPASNYEGYELVESTNDIYLISDGKSSYWNNNSGWVNMSEATEFTFEEFLNLDLPIEGYWVAKHNANFEQYYLEKLESIKKIVRYVIYENPKSSESAISEINKLLEDIPNGKS